MHSLAVPPGRGHYLVFVLAESPYAEVSVSEVLREDAEALSKDEAAIGRAECW